MKATKDCDVIKDLYSSYLNEELEDSTMNWMQEHLKACISCKDWTENYIEETASGKERNNKAVPIPQDEVKVIKRARIFLMTGIIIVTALALWMSLWIVS